MTDVPVMATGQWANNAELIADVHRLGYLRDDDEILDPTWGLGRFWTTWRPHRLEGSDLNPAKSPTGAPTSFTDLPWPDLAFDVVVLDPPYKLNGTGGSHPSDDDYGVATSGISWQTKHKLIRLGLNEAARVARRHILLKCQDQVCSGKVRWQTIEFTNHAWSLDWRLVDRFDIVSYRPQPVGRRQVHARRNSSTLLVFGR